MWILYVFLYGFGIGIYRLLNKKSVSKSRVLSSLTIFVTSAFIMVLWRTGDAFSIEPDMLWWIALKSSIIAASWHTSFHAMKSLGVSKSTLIKTFSLVLTILGGVIFFKESLEWYDILGAILVFFGVVLTAQKKEIRSEKVKFKPVFLAILSAIFGAGASLVDKHALGSVTVGQMQYWFFFFLMVIFLIVSTAASIKEKKIIIEKNDLKNFFIYIAAATLVVSDIFLFTALSDPNSVVSMTTVLSKISVVVVFIGSAIFFKEKITLTKTLYLLLIISGIVLTAI